MERFGDTQPYRGIEFGVHEIKPREWQWEYLPPRGLFTQAPTLFCCGNSGARRAAQHAREPNRPAARRQLSMVWSSRLNGLVMKQLLDLILPRDAGRTDRTHKHRVGIS
jgi:hypothetical protein